MCFLVSHDIGTKFCYSSRNTLYACVSWVGDQKWFFSYKKMCCFLVCPGMGTIY